LDERRVNGRKTVTPIQPAKLVDSPIAYPTEQDQWALKKIDGELFYGGHFVSSVMTQEQYEKVCPFIVVKDSAIDGRGVFAPGN
jgi:hypothetical protein